MAEVMQEMPFERLQGEKNGLGQGETRGSLECLQGRVETFWCWREQI